MRLDFVKKQKLYFIRSPTNPKLLSNDLSAIYIFFPKVHFSGVLIIVQLFTFLLLLLYIFSDECSPVRVPRPICSWIDIPH